MATIKYEERMLDKVVYQYLASRRTRDRPLSVLGAVKAVRSVLRCPDTTDEELGQLIATVAVAQGYNIAFDIRGISTRPTPALVSKLKDPPPSPVPNAAKNSS
jgi:hypothetical protein